MRVVLLELFYEAQDPLKLRREIDDWMANYDERQEEKKRLAKETQAGFRLVLCQR